MFIRRYYRNNNVYDKTYSNEYFTLMLEKYGNLALEYDTADYEFVFETQREKDDYVRDSYERVLQNTSWYMENLSKVPTFSKSNKVYDNDVDCFTVEGVLVGEQKPNKTTEKPKGLNTLSVE